MRARLSLYVLARNMQVNDSKTDMIQFYNQKKYAVVDQLAHKYNTNSFFRTVAAVGLCCLQIHGF